MRNTLNTLNTLTTTNSNSKLTNTRKWPSIGHRFHPSQEWEGHVLTAGTTSFTARLRDLTADSTYEEEEAEFPIEEISQQDRPRVQPGAVFTWSIGHEDTVSGVRKRVSVIEFRKPSTISEKDLRDGRA